MQKIHLHTADRRELKEGGVVRAEAGEELIVGVEISRERAIKLVDRGGAIVVGGGTLDALDHDGNGRKGGSAPAKA